MGLCLSCRTSKARFRDKGTKLCTSLHSAVSPLHAVNEEIITNQCNGFPPVIVQNDSSTKLHRGSMSNMIKGLVSKRRNRYKEDGFNLDLTYITEKIIAMGFPACNIEGVYRNNIEDVSKFLEAKHKDHYKIYNLCSERSYDISKFHNRVEVFPFDDHNPPKLELIEPFCNNVQTWLNAHENNVAVVHCKAGKGRTGTMICCYLLHSRQFSRAEDALNFYGQKRTQDRKGVTIPSQVRYVNYYAKLVREELKYEPVSLYIREIILEPPPIFAGGQGSVCFAISQQSLNEKHELCVQKINKLYKSGVYEVKRGAEVFNIELECCLPITGDIKVEFYNKKIRKEKQFQFWVNTFFVANCATEGERNGVAGPSRGSRDSTFTLTLKKCELDIVNKKDKQNKSFTSDFRVTVVFNRVPKKSASWMATPPKEPPTIPIDNTPSESSEADTTDDSVDEDGWDSGPNSRFERTVLQLNESDAFSESIAGKQEPSNNQPATLPRVILLQNLRPPNFGILNKLPYLTLQPPLFALPQQIEDEILTSLPGPASNSVELEKRSKIYAKENYYNRSEEVPIGLNVVNDVQLETTIGLNDDTVLARSELTEKSILETSQSDSATSLDLSSETPTTEINDVSSADIASRQGKESEGTTVITKVINELQATFNDDTTNDSLNLKSSTQNEFDESKTTLQYSTSDDISTQQIISTTQSNLNSEDLSSTATEVRVLPNDQNTERITDATDDKSELINSRYGLPETTSALEASVAQDDLVSDAPTAKSNIGGVEPKDSIETTTSLVPSTQTEFPKFDPNELTNLNSRSGIFETRVTDGLVSTVSGLGTTVKIEETTLATNPKDLFETEDASKFSTTVEQVQVVEDISRTNLDEFGSSETATTSKSICEDNFVTADVILDDPIASTQSVKKLTTQDVELGNRVSEVEGREDQQPNEIVISANLESSSVNPTATEVTANEGSTQTTLKPDVNSPFGVYDDLKLSNRVSEAEDVTTGREGQQPNDIVISVNLETSSVHPTTAAVTTVEGSTQTTFKPDVNSAFGGYGGVNETSTEELVVLTTTEDLKLSNRVSEVEDVTSGREDEQPNEIVISANLESSSKNPTTTDVITTDRNTERITETTVKEVELVGTVKTPYGVTHVSQTSAEELVLLTTTASSVDVATKNILEDGQASKPDGTTSSTEEVIASTNVPATQSELQPRINIEEEQATVSSRKLSEELLPPLLENIKSDVSVSYGLNYKPDSNDITYTISTTVKSILTHKSGEDGNVTSEVNAVVNATSVLQDQNNASGFSTALAGNVSSIRQGPESEAVGAPDGGFGIELNKTENAPEINIRLLPPFAFAPNGIHGRLGESDAKLSTTITPNVFDVNKGNKGLGQTTFTLPSNTQFTIKLDKPGFSDGKTSPRDNNFGQGILRSSFSDFGTIKGNFNSNTGSIRGNLGPSTTPSSSSQFTIKLDKPNIGADPNFSVQFNNAPKTGIQSSDARQNVYYDSGSITGNSDDAKGGLVSPSSSSEVGRSTNLPTNNAQFAVDINKNNGGSNLSFQYSSVPNGNQEKFGSSLPSRSNSNENVRGTLASNYEAEAPTGFDFKEQVNFNSVINIGNNPPKPADGNSSDKPSKFRSVTIDTSPANDPSELLKNYKQNKNGLNTPGSSSPGRYVQAKYVGQTSVNPALKSGTTTLDESITNDSFKNKFGFDLSFLNRGINSSKSSPKVSNLGSSKTESPQTPHFNKPFRPRTSGGNNKSNTFGVSIGPYRDTIIKHTGKGWSLRTYDKLILHTGLSGQYL